jgi:serine protease AprX
MFNRRTMALSLFVVFAVVHGTMAQEQGETRQKVLIKAQRPYGALVSQIESRGGTVTHQYRYWDGIAAELPVDALQAVAALAGGGAVSKDFVIPLPSDADRLSRMVPTEAAEAMADSVETLDLGSLSSLAEASPQGYTINNAIANATPLHAAGVTGSGIVVAVIDSGLRPGFPHIAGGIVGCDNFVPTGSCSAFENNGHGTFVAGMVRANVIFTFAEGSALRQAVLAECPSCFFNPPTNTQIPMIGTAPLSSIYALRVFPTTGGARTSWILAAIERAIELREQFDAGQGGANVRVVNMSLAGPSVFPGRDMFDRAVAALLEYDIVPVIAAANAGPSSLTLGSPASSIGSLSVGAASLPHNERILRRVQFGATLGSLYRPFLSPQMAYFSSRGPNPDGRVSPHVVSNGFACYGMGTGATTSTISIGSGTSYAAPSVAGVAALLAQAFPAATARQIRNAIIASANPGLLADGSTPVDQGAGYVNALGAASLLNTGTVPDALESQGAFNKNVKTNVARTTHLTVREGVVVESVSNLRPGERYDILYDVPPNTRQVLVNVSNVTPVLPPPQQNQLFGDDILLAIHSAKTSSIGQGDYHHLAFTTGGAFVVDEPEPGLMRVTLNGDWTNAGTISADVMITPLQAPLPQLTRQGRIAQSQLLAFPIQVPPETSRAEFRLEWREDWGRYPTGDIDLILVRPDGTLIFDGATLNNPELVFVDNPASGPWTVLVSGFELHTTDDRFELRVALDGKVVR